MMIGRHIGARTIELQPKSPPTYVRKDGNKCNCQYFGRSDSGTKALREIYGLAIQRSLMVKETGAAVIETGSGSLIT